MNQLILIEQNQTKFNYNLFQPIKNYVRIRYTNFAINSKYLICGTSSGGLYLFSRLKNNELKFLFTIPSNNGKISSIVFSRNNLDLFAFGTNRGIFKLILLKLTTSSDNLDKQQWQEIYCAKAFTKHSINLIVFQDDDLNEFRIFLSDDGFNIYMISKMKTFSSLIFKSEPPVRILNFDYPINQLEADNQYLLVSTDDKSSIFNMEKLSLNKVGTKSRPIGIFGSCFYSIDNEDEIKLKYIFTARPSLRLWQSNQEGSVICTHQFKDYLNKSDCDFIYQFKEQEHNEELMKINLNSIKSKTQFTNSYFNQIYKLNFKGFIYLVTFTNAPKTMLFIINPLNAQIIFWTNQFTNPITNILITENELIICHYKNESNQNLNSESSIKEDERLFTFIKVYDLNDLNEDSLFQLSNLSLFCFLKNNQLILGDLLKEMPNLKNHIDLEWQKLDDELKLTLDDNLKSFIDNNYENSIYLSCNCDLESSDKDDLTNDNLIKNNKIEEITNGNDHHLNNGSTNNELNEKSTTETNGKISIEQLTSKHRWKKEEPIDEKKLLRKKLNKLIQNLNKKQISKLKCNCNYPAPRSHLMINSKQKEIRLILIKLLDDNNIDEIIEICFENAIWNLYLDLLILKHQFIDYIKISLLLMDINLLTNNSIFIQILKSNLELIKILFNLFVEQKNLNSNKSLNKAICLNCKINLDSDYMKWQDIIDFLYKNLKLDDLLDLLIIHNQSLPNSVLNSKLCIHLLQTEMLKQYESSLTNDKLTKLNQHLTIRKKQQNKSGQIIDQNNWSMYLDLTKKECDICKKSLKNCREALLIFRCNHVYHKDCDESNLTIKKNCYICINSK